MQEPRATKIPHRLEAHGDVRIDDYYWLNQRENPEVIQYLNDENAYREEKMKHTASFQKVLYDEMVGRIKQDDESVPYELDGYFYYSRFESGKEYPLHCRKKGSLDSNEEIMLDVNELASGHSYCQVSGISVHPNKKIIAYGIDTQSRRIYTIKFKNLETGEHLEDLIPNTTGGATWSANGDVVFYSTKDEQTLRPDKIWKHRIGAPAGSDEMVYFESDETFNTFVYKTKSKKFILIGSSSTLSDEYRFIPADQPDADFVIFQPRMRDLEYAVSHFGNEWFIRTNAHGATNFKLMKCSLNDTNIHAWTEVIPHRNEVLLEGLEIFRHCMVLEERSNGLTQLRIINADGNEHYLDFGEDTYTAYIGTNPDFDASYLRYGYTSLTTPNSVIDYDFETRVKTIRKEQEVVGGYDKSLYHSERVWFDAQDGVKVPVSLVYKRELKRESGNPTLLYGYGSYGITVDPTFSSTRLSLLDRGFVFAIAHIRGGQYLGRPWYEDGKLLRKMNTFNDFIACGRGMITSGYASKDALFAEGGSAGGLLMGAVINQAPELWRGVLAAVPFVDVVTTMLDDSIPLTTGEYDEWGNPNDPTYYEYMKSYSPYDQVKAQDYPALLITTGLHDSQVQYWEPAKWIAKLREMRTNDEPLMMFTNMDTGHGGASGRFEAYKEAAMEYAFLLDRAGITA